MRLPKNVTNPLISHFSQGKLEPIKEAVGKRGNIIFETKPLLSRDYKQVKQRLIFYSFLNSKFDIIEYYLSTENPIALSSLESRLLGDKIAYKKRFISWFKFLESNKKVIEFIHYEFFIESLIDTLAHNYENYDDIESYINLFQNETKQIKIEELISKCSETTKGKQLKRHLKILQIL